MRNPSDSTPTPHPKSPQKLAQLVLLGEEHSGRDEMNLAGHPFALLQAPGRRHSVNEIYYEWPRELPSGRQVTASWRVGTDAKFGLPGPNEELVYLLLLQMAREQTLPGQQWPQIVRFSRGDLLARLSWNLSAPGAIALDLAFARLNAVNITAKWAFWNARAKSPAETTGFHIISNYSITPEPMGRKRGGALPLSWFRFDEIVYESLLSGNVRSLALDFALSLSSPTARRLFRLLDMLRLAKKAPRKDLSIGLFKLRDRLGMTPYNQPSRVREKLAPGLEELLSVGFLGEVEWQTARDGSPMALFRFANPSRPQVVARPVKGLQIASDGPTEPLTPVESPQEFARRMNAAFGALPEDEQSELRQQARQQVAPAFWDRLEAPESPMSLGLWQLVADKIGQE